MTRHICHLSAVTRAQRARLSSLQENRARAQPGPAAQQQAASDSSHTQNLNAPFAYPARVRGARLGSLEKYMFYQMERQLAVKQHLDPLAQPQGAQHRAGAA